MPQSSWRMWTWRYKRRRGRLRIYLSRRAEHVALRGPIQESRAASRDACCASLRASPPAPPVHCETAESLSWATNPTLRRLLLRCNAFPAPTYQSGFRLALSSDSHRSLSQAIPKPHAPIPRVITMPSSLPVLESRIGSFFRLLWLVVSFHL